MSKCSKTSCIFIVWWLCFWVGSILIKHIFILLIWFFAIIFENLLPDCFWAIVAFPPARKWRRKRRRAAVLPSPITAGNKNGRCRCRGKPARGWAKVPRCFWSFEDPNEKVRCYCSGWPGVVFWDEPLWAPSRGEVGPSPCGFDVRNSPPKGVQQARLRGPDSEFWCGYMHPTWRAFTLVLLRLGYSVIVKLANWSLSCKFLSCECRTHLFPPLLSTQEQGERWRSTLGAPRIISTSFRLLSLAERKIRCKWLWIRTIRSCKIEESWSHNLKCYHKCYNSRGVPKSETHFILEFLWDAYLPSLSNPLDLRFKRRIREQQHCFWFLLEGVNK